MTSSSDKPPATVTTNGSQGAAPVNQHGKSAADIAREAIDAILDGNQPSDHRPEDMGQFAEVYQEMVMAHQQGGTEAARIVYLKYADLDPAVAELRAADPEPEQPSSILTWPIRTLDDAYTERPPIQYVVDGMFAEASLNIVYGPPGSLKSMVLADLCCCIAAGLDWLPPIPDFEPAADPIPTTQSPILWIDFDNGTRRTDDRFDALAKSRKLPTDTPIHYVAMPKPWLDASSSLQVTELAQLIKQLGARFTVIDNLGLVTGDVEENSAKMSQVMGNLRWLAETSGAAIVVIHHQRKGGGTSSGRKGDTLRGHSSIEASLDLAMVVERPDGSDDVTLIPTKVRGPDPKKMAALFTYEWKEGSKELGEARFWGQITESFRADDAIEEAILDILQEHDEMSKTALVNAVKEAVPEIGVNIIRNHIPTMVKANLISEKSVGGGRSRKNYSLAELPGAVIG